MANKDFINAYIQFVMADDDSPLLACCFKHGIDIPSDKDEFAAGVYIAVQDEQEICEEVKQTARMKLTEILKRRGFTSWL